MNEITKIHLGRQAFTISVDAHKALQEYLRAIKKHMGDTDEAVEEVELRMAELLTERGISGDKVVLLKDVDYLKEQLGEPGDFGDEESETAREDVGAPKRLFRDTDNAMIAGVAAGIGKYFGVDPLWVRLGFIALTFAGASGILLYIILWLIVPEAKTKSEHLQMQGKPVTVDALKEVVERADVKGAAQRATEVVGKAVNGVLKVVLAVVGLGLMLAGIGALLGLTAASIYWALNHDLVPANIFPVGASEVALIAAAMLFAAMMALFFLVSGIAMIKRKWPLPGWALGAMVAVWLVSLAVGSALAADAAPKIRDRYEAAQHTYTMDVPEFNKLNALGSFDTSIEYRESNESSVTLEYWGDVDFSKMKAEVKNQTLTIDSNALADSVRCDRFCLFHSPILRVIVHGPKLQEVTTDMQGAQLNLPNLQNQTIKIHTTGNSVYLPNVVADTVRAERTSDNSWILTFSGSYRGVAMPQEVSVFEKTATIYAKNLDLKFEGKCAVSLENSTSEVVYLGKFEDLTLNGRHIGGVSDWARILDEIGPSAEKCLNVSSEPSESLQGNIRVQEQIESFSDN